MLRKLATLFCAFFAVVYIALLAMDAAEMVVFRFSPETYRSVDITEFGRLITLIAKHHDPDDSLVGVEEILLDYDKDFRSLYYSKEDLVDKVLTWLAEPGHSRLERQVAVVVVQNVSVAEWVRFTSNMLDMFEKGQVDFWALDGSIWPRAFYSKHWTDDFWRPSVRHVLYRFMLVKDPHNTFWTNNLFSMFCPLTLLDYFFYCMKCA